MGEAFDSTYCSSSVTTSLWGFGYNGCLVPSNPPRMPDSYADLYNYVKGKTGVAKPTAALFSSSDQAGSTAAKLQTVAANGAGFKVVFAKGIIPSTATDYTPYVEQIMTSAGGKQPQTAVCLVAVQCVAIWTALKNAGFTGTYQSPLGDVTALHAALQGTVTQALYNTNPTSPAYVKMQQAINAFAPGTALTSYANVPAYFAAAMFVQAVHEVQTSNQSITPANVQKALSKITFEIPGLVGPTQYPASTAISTPSCGELISFTGGSAKIIDPYACNTKSFKVTTKSETVG